MDSGLVCLAMVAGFHGRATNPDQPSHNLAHSPAADAILRAAKRLELKAKLRTLDLGRAAYGKTALSIIEFGYGGFTVLARRTAR